MKFLITLALTLTLSPSSSLRFDAITPKPKVKADAARGQPAVISVLSVDRPANPAAGFSEDAGNVSSSPSVFALLQRDHKI
jgi:hypothetical protein